MNVIPAASFASCCKALARWADGDPKEISEKDLMGSGEGRACFDAIARTVEACLRWKDAPCGEKILLTLRFQRLQERRDLRLQESSWMRYIASLFFSWMRGLDQSLALIEQHKQALGISSLNPSQRKSWEAILSYDVKNETKSLLMEMVVDFYSDGWELYYRDFFKVFDPKNRSSHSDEEKAALLKILGSTPRHDRARMLKPLMRPRGSSPDGRELWPIVGKVVESAEPAKKGEEIRRCIEFLEAINEPERADPLPVWAVQKLLGRAGAADLKNRVRVTRALLCVVHCHIDLEKDCQTSARIMESLLHPDLTDAFTNDFLSVMSHLRTYHVEVSIFRNISNIAPGKGYSVNELNSLLQESNSDQQQRYQDGTNELYQVISEGLDLENRELYFELCASFIGAREYVYTALFLERVHPLLRQLLCGRSEDIAKKMMKHARESGIRLYLSNVPKEWQEKYSRMALKHLGTLPDEDAARRYVEEFLKWAKANNVEAFEKSVSTDPKDP